jgi:hypothetical protein
MKALFNFLAFTLVVGLISTAFVSESSSVKSKTEKAVFKTQLSEHDANVVVEKVYELNGLVRTEIMLNTTRFGVCDTCSGSFETALKVNRQLVDSLNKENGALYENYVKAIDLNQELTDINKLVSKEIEKSKLILKK